MNICNTKDVSSLTFTHRGMNVNMILHVQPLFCPQFEETAKPELTRAQFQFNDIREIDSLICALQNFKNQCIGYSGNWKVVDGGDNHAG